MRDIGAELAPAKSTTFSTNRKTRARLREHIWEEISKTIAVVVHARDLGSHLTTGVTMCSPTLTQRLHNAAEIVNRIARTNFSRKLKAHTIRISSGRTCQGAVRSGVFSRMPAGIAEAQDRNCQCYCAALRHTILGHYFFNCSNWQRH